MQRLRRILFFYLPNVQKSRFLHNFALCTNHLPQPFILIYSMEKINYRHLILFGSALLMTVSPAIAKQLSEDEARSVAMSFIGKNSPKFNKVTVKDRELKVAYIAERKATNAFYVFNHGDEAGFMIVSADDQLPQVLGYSSTGSFDYASAPENIKWWLSQYEEEVYSYLSQEKATSILKAVPRRTADNKTVISPLIKTQWNQDAPFNNDCPTDGGGRSVTGCAATALAQIINYHEYPSKNGTGTYSYSWNGQTLSYDYSIANFDWNNMLDRYDATSSKTSQDAVANLMLACGIGLHMNYSSRESGASDIAVPRFLVENMDYDGSAIIVQRMHYSFQEWQDLIYKELSEKRPVFYTGQANTGGHAFICDGYSGDGYFHFNWGWGGQSDGDFLLSALNPMDQGIGSYEGGYNSGQTAVINIMKNQGNGRCAILFASSGFTYENGIFNCGPISNFSTFEVNATLGIEIINDNGIGESQYFNGTNISIPGANLDAGQYSSGIRPFIVNPQNLAPGKYRCYPVYKTADTPWCRLRPTYGEQQYVELTVGEDGSMTYTNPGAEVTYDLTATSFSVTGKVYKDSENIFSITVKNNADADYNNNIRMDVSQNGEVVKSLNIKAAIPSKQVFEGLYKTSFGLEHGSYDVNFFDATGKSINSKPFTLTVEEGNAPVPATGLILQGLGSDIFYSGYTSTLQLILHNNSTTTISVNQFELSITDTQGNNLCTYSINGYTFNANMILNYNIGTFSIPAGAGKYFLELSADDKSLGEPIAIYNADKADNIWYTLTEDAAHARLVRAPNSIAIAKGIFDIPSTVLLANTSFEVTAAERDAFANYSGISTIFLRPENAPTGIGAAVASLPSETVFYVENYDNYVDQLGENIYAILKKLELSEPVSSALSMNTGDEFQFDIIYTPAEHINHEVSVISNPEGLFEFTTGTFANGQKTVNCKFLKAGTGVITVTSAQPGTAIKNSLEIESIPTGLEHITEESVLNVAKRGNTLIISGLAKSTAVNVFNAAGQTVASRVSDGQTIYIDMPAAGFYIVSAGNKSLKITF